MLAYLFWHRPSASIEAARYEAALVQFHRQLAAQRAPGFRGSASFRVPALPWLSGESGYEDWCLVEGSWALDPLNEIAVSGQMTAAHDAAASAMEEGHGGLYSLVWGEPDLPARSSLVWLTRPRGIQWRPVLEALRESVPQACCWRRQMVLGPGREFALAVPDGQAVTAPTGWTSFAVERVRVTAQP
jgi:hypothetical protein